jgi:hypothetical protein
MKTTNFFFGTRKFATIAVTSCFAIFVLSEAAYGSQASLPGGRSIELEGPLTGEMKDRFGDGWAKATFIRKGGQRLHLLSEEQLTKDGGVLFEGVDQRNVSATGHFVVLPVVRQGTLESAGEKPRIEGREYCPVIETTTGCIVTMQTGEICGGEWSSKGDRWMDATVDRTAEMTEKTTSDANALWKEFSNSSVRLKLHDVIVSNMGISNVMACDPVSDGNRKSYLAIAEQLKIEKATSPAAYIESKLALPAGKPPQLSGARARVSVDRAWLYDFQNPDAKTKMYIVRDDVVTVVDANKSGWTQVDYSEANGRVLRKWIRTDSVKSDTVNSPK